MEEEMDLMTWAKTETPKSSNVTSLLWTTIILLVIGIIIVCLIIHFASDKKSSGSSGKKVKREFIDRNTGKAVSADEVGDKYQIVNA